MYTMLSIPIQEVTVTFRLMYHQISISKGRNRTNTERGIRVKNNVHKAIAIKTLQNSKSINFISKVIATQSTS
jgi:predicted HicB family RNase H-like nuclease